MYHQRHRLQSSGWTAHKRVTGHILTGYESISSGSGWRCYRSVKAVLCGCETRIYLCGCHTRFLKNRVSHPVFFELFWSGLRWSPTMVLITEAHYMYLLYPTMTEMTWIYPIVIWEPSSIVLWDCNGVNNRYCSVKAFWCGCEARIFSYGCDTRIRVMPGFFIRVWHPDMCDTRIFISSFVRVYNIDLWTWWATTGTRHRELIPNDDGSN